MNTDNKPKTFIVTVRWCETNGCEQGSLKKREITPAQLAALKAVLFPQEGEK